MLERGLDTSSGLDFVQERLALLAKTLFLVSFGFYLFLLASMVLVGGAPFVAVVQRADRARAPLRQLDDGPGLAGDQPGAALAAEPGAIDAMSLVLAGVFLSLMTVYDEGQILQTLLALLVTVMVRAILLPSRPGRTMLLTALVYLPTVIVCIARHHPVDFLPGFTPGFRSCT